MILFENIWPLTQAKEDLEAPGFVMLSSGQQTVEGTYWQMALKATQPKVYITAPSY